MTWTVKDRLNHVTPVHNFLIVEIKLYSIILTFILVKYFVYSLGCK